MRMLQASMVVGTILACSPSLWAQTQYTGYGDPTPSEQHALELINRARANPTAEGNRLSAANEASDATLTNHLSPGIPSGNISEGLVAPDNVVGARPPLAMNIILLGTARAHNQDLYNNDIFQHNSSTGVTFDTRMTNAGYTWFVPGGMAGENIAYAGSSGGGLNATAAQLENLLMIDNGIAGRGHRVNLLDTYTAPYFREIGIGYLHNNTPTPNRDMTDVMTQDFGRRPSVGPFVLGVVYNDTNSNNFYDLGEGMAGVTVTLNPAGSSFAVTSSAGGYAFLASTSAAITVQATGGPFGSAVASKTLTPGFPGENVKVDFKLSEAAITDSDSDGLADVWENSNFGNLAETAAGDPDLDTFSNLAEFNAGSDPMDPGSIPTPPVPPAAPKKKGGGGGGCGLTGLEGVLLLGLLRLRRLARR